MYSLSKVVDGNSHPLGNSKLEALAVFESGTFPYLKYEHNANEVPNNSGR